MGLPWDIHGTVVLSWGTMQLPCESHGIALSPCAFHETPMEGSHAFHGISMGLQGSHESLVGLLWYFHEAWDLHGTSLGLPWDLPRISMGLECLDGISMGRPRDYSASI